MYLVHYISNRVSMSSSHFTGQRQYLLQFHIGSLQLLLPLILILWRKTFIFIKSICSLFHFRLFYCVWSKPGWLYLTRRNVPATEKQSGKGMKLRYFCKTFSSSYLDTEICLCYCFTSWNVWLIFFFWEKKPNLFACLPICIPSIIEFLFSY